MNFKNVTIAFLIVYKLIIPYPPYPKTPDVAAKVNDNINPIQQEDAILCDKLYKDGKISEIKYYEDGKLLSHYKFMYEDQTIVVTFFDVDGETIVSTELIQL